MTDYIITDSHTIVNKIAAKFYYRQKLAVFLYICHLVFIAIAGAAGTKSTVYADIGWIPADIGCTVGRDTGACACLDTSINDPSHTELNKAQKAFCSQDSHDAAKRLRASARQNTVRLKNQRKMRCAFQNQCRHRSMWQRQCGKYRQSFLCNLYRQSIQSQGGTPLLH